jgi:hypothetical protein
VMAASAFGPGPAAPPAQGLASGAEQLPGARVEQLAAPPLRRRARRD